MYRQIAPGACRVLAIVGAVMVLSSCQSSSRSVDHRIIESSENATAKVGLFGLSDSDLMELLVDTVATEGLAKQHADHPEKARQHWRAARANYERLLEEFGEHGAIHVALARSCYSEARLVPKAELEEARRLWALAREHFAAAYERAYVEDGMFLEWGYTFIDEADEVKGSSVGDAQELWRQAEELFAWMLEIMPDSHAAANNWGIVLSSEAEAIAGTDLAGARLLWAAAREKYRWALEIKPDKHNAHGNLGSACSNEALALAQQGRWEEAESVWQLMDRHFDNALLHTPEPGTTLSNFAVCKSERARLLERRDPSRASADWESAREMFARAVAADPTRLRTHEARIVSTLRVATVYEGRNSPRRLALAESALLQAQETLSQFPHWPSGPKHAAWAWRERMWALAEAKNFDRTDEIWPQVLACHQRLWEQMGDADAAHNLAGVTSERARELLGRGSHDAALWEMARFFNTKRRELDPMSPFPIVAFAKCDFEESNAYPRGAEQRTKLLESALGRFREALAVDPKCVDAWNGVAYTSAAIAREAKESDHKRNAWADAIEARTNACQWGNDDIEDRLWLARTCRDAAGEMIMSAPVDGHRWIRTGLEACEAILRASRNHVESRKLASEFHAMAGSDLHRPNPREAFERLRQAHEILQTLEGEGALEAEDCWRWAHALALGADIIARRDVHAARPLWQKSDELYRRAEVKLSQFAPFVLDWIIMSQMEAPSLALLDAPAARAKWESTRKLARRHREIEPESPLSWLEEGLAAMREYSSLAGPSRFMRRDLLDHAEGCFLMAEEKRTGSGSYNLACVYAWRGRPREVVRWLDRAKAADQLPHPDIVLADTFLALVAAAPEVRSWMENYQSSLRRH